MQRGDQTRALVRDAPAEREHEQRLEGTQQQLDEKHGPRPARPRQQQDRRDQIGVERRLVEDLLAAPPAVPRLERRHLPHPGEVRMVGIAAQPIARDDALGPAPERVDVRLGEDQREARERGVVDREVMQQPDRHRHERRSRRPLGASSPWAEPALRHDVADHPDPQQLQRADQQDQALFRDVLQHEQVVAERDRRRARRARR